MTKFRLTIGENGTKWGKQEVVFTSEANNAIEFIEKYVELATQFSFRKEAIEFVKNCWVDAGNNTIPVDVQNLVVFGS